MYNLDNRGYAKIDSKTVRAHLDDMEARNWLVTQTWGWDAQGDLPEGDALVVCCHTFSDPHRPAFVFIRLGSEVKMVRADSLYAAMRSLGLNP